MSVNRYFPLLRCYLNIFWENRFLSCKVKSVRRLDMNKQSKPFANRMVTDIRCSSKYKHKIAEVVDNRYIVIRCRSCGYKEIIDMNLYLDK